MMINKSMLLSALCLACTMLPSFVVNAQSLAGGPENNVMSTFATLKTDDDSTSSLATRPQRSLYHMNYLVTGSFCVLATAANVYAIPNIIKAKKPMTDAELAALNPNIFTGFDRWALEQDVTKKTDYYKASDIALPIIIGATGALGFDKKIRKDWFNLLLMYYEVHAVTFSLYNFSPLGPAFQNKVRPISYYEAWPIEERRAGNNRNSLYSGHTATAMASTFFMVKIYSDYHPELGRKKYLLYTIAALPAILEGYLRVKALAHFPSDGMVGLIVGATCGVAIPALHRYKNRNLALGLIGTPVGPGICVNWHPN